MPGNSKSTQHIHISTAFLMKSEIPTSMEECFFSSISRSELKNAATSLVAPAVESREHCIPLSNLDLIITPVYTSVVMFYKANGDLQQDKVSKLKHSLAKVLVDYYHFAGRLVQGSDGLPILLCNDAGAVFGEAFIDGELGEELPAESFQHCEVLSQVVDNTLIGSGPRYDVSSPGGLPLLLIQVTSFSCGGLAILVKWNHMASDGDGDCRFVKYWADSCTGLQVGSDVPCHDRSLIKARDPPRVLVPQTLLNVQGFSWKWVQPAMQMFEFSSAELQALGQEARKEGNCTLTTFDCLSGHLWRCITRSRKHSTDEDKAYLVAVVNGRTKLDPPLPPSYSGNVLYECCTVTTAADLVDKPLSYAAEGIHAAVTSTTTEVFQSLIDWKELNKFKSSTMGIPPGVSPSQMVLISSWRHFPLYETDFGWGKPILATITASPLHSIEGTGWVLPSCTPGNVNVLIYLSPDDMGRLKQDPALRSITSDNF